MGFYGTPRSDIPTFSCVRIGVNIHADMIAWRAEGDLDLEAGVSTTMSCSREPATFRPVHQLPRQSIDSAWVDRVPTVEISISKTCLRRWMILPLPDSRGGPQQFDPPRESLRHPVVRWGESTFRGEIAALKLEAPFSSGDTSG